MKGLRVFLLSGLLAASFLLTMQKDVAAVDVSLGATMWTAIWEPSFYHQDLGMLNQKNKTILGPVFGPVLSVKLTDRLSVSNVFLIGFFSPEITGNMDLGVLGIADTKISFNVKRYDNDLTLNYVVNSYIKVFGGLKYLGYDYSYKSVTTASGSTYTSTSNSTNNGIGPGAGVAFSYPVTNNLYALANLSAMYLRATTTATGSPSTDFNAFGGNGSVSLAYYIPEYSVTTSLGLRYQQIKYNPTGSNSGSAETDKFYGLVLSIIYTF